MTGTEIAVVTPAQLEVMQQHARLLASARSELVPRAFRGSPGDVLMALEYGRSLNLGVAQIFTELYIVKGRPSMSAKLMMSLVLRAGHRIRADISADGMAATCKITRTDDPEPYRETFTIDDAVQAGLCEIKNGKVQARDKNGEPTPWERYTKTMLRNRAISAAVRAFCPDVLTSVSYTPEELQDDDSLIIDGTIIQAAAADPVPDQATDQPATAAGDTAEAAPAFTAPAAPNEAQWRTTWFDDLSDAVRRRNLADISRLGQDAAQAGHSDLIDAARAAWTRVQQTPIPDQPTGGDDQGDDTGGADMDDPVVDAELVDQEGADQ